MLRSLGVARRDALFSPTDELSCLCNVLGKQHFLRGGGALYEEAVLKWLADPKREGGPEGLIDFSISAELTKELRAACANIPDRGWTPIEQRVHETVFAAEVEFAPGDWPKNAAPCRYATLRQSSWGLQLDLDGKFAIKHLAVVTNRHDLDAAKLLRWHWERWLRLGCRMRRGISLLLDAQWRAANHSILVGCGVRPTSSSVLRLPRKLGRSASLTASVEGAFHRGLRRSLSRGTTVAIGVGDPKSVRGRVISASSRGGDWVVFLDHVGVLDRSMRWLAPRVVHRDWWAAPDWSSGASRQRSGRHSGSTAGVRARS